MKYWLVKSEPNAWSWYGVRTYQASNNMKAMSIGDRAFFYHSVKEKRIVGIVEVVREYYPDHTDPKGRFGMVDFEAVEPVPNPVTLEDIKGDERLHELALLKQSRLSVVPIDEASWKIICDMGGVKP